jgi:hypothetical protein
MTDTNNADGYGNASLASRSVEKRVEKVVVRCVTSH